jgi:hypothetical protein
MPDAAPVEACERMIGGPDRQLAYAVAMNETTIVIVGGLAGSADFGDGTLISAGQRDVFIATYDRDCNPLSSQRFGDSADQTAVDVTFDSQGNIVVVGTFAGSLDLGGPVLVSSVFVDVFVASMDPSLQHRWSMQLGAAAGGVSGAMGETVFKAVAEKVVVDASDAPLVVGSYNGQLSASGCAVGDHGVEDAYAVRIDPSGTGCSWARSWGKAGGQMQARTVALAPGGRIAVGGTTDGAELAVDVSLSAGGFLLVLESNADVAWHRSWAGADIVSHVIAVGEDFVIAGVMQAPVDFGGGALTPFGGHDLFAARLAGDDGAHVWSRVWGDITTQQPAGLGLVGGRVCLLAAYQVSLFPESLPTPTFFDLALVVVDDEGKTIFAERQSEGFVGGVTRSAGAAIAVVTSFPPSSEDILLRVLTPGAM